MALADEPLEEVLYDSNAWRGFARIDLSTNEAPDAITLLKFRHLLATHDLCKGLFSAINADLTARGLLARAGSLVDANLIAAPSSTKNQERKRDPELHQIKKGHQWYFGRKAHPDADRDSQLVPTVVTTAAKVVDITKTAEFLHGGEKQGRLHQGGEAGGNRCLGTEDRLAGVRKRGVIKALAEGAEKAALKPLEKAKASVRAFAEHPLHIVKNLFKHRQ